MRGIFDHIVLKIYRFLHKIIGTKFSFSADGEDIILKKFFSGIEKGFYIDLGAHNYIDGSNTYYFYLQGWSGICVDSLPGVKKKFKKKRPRDLFLDNAIVPNSFKAENVNFYFFKDLPDNSTISKKRINNVGKSFNRYPTDVILVKALSVSDFMKEKIFPWIICVEEIGMYVESIRVKSSIYRLLKRNSYLLMQRTFLTSIYVHSSSLKKFKSPYVKEIILEK